MGIVRSKLARAVRNYNVVYRAEKVLERRAKPDLAPEPAPKHASTVEKIGSFRQENPELLEAVTTKSESLHDNLKSVYVESQGDNPEIQAKVKYEESLPVSRAVHDETELGSMEIDYDVPAGKISLRTALELLSKHQQDPQTNSAAVLASEHQLDQADMQKVIRHFKVLQLHIPKEMYAKNKNMKKLVQQQMAYSKSYMTKNLQIPSDKEIKEIKKKLEESPANKT